MVKRTGLVLLAIVLAMQSGGCGGSSSSHGVTDTAPFPDTALPDVTLPDGSQARDTVTGSKDEESPPDTAVTDTVTVADTGSDTAAVTDTGSDSGSVTDTGSDSGSVTDTAADTGSVADTGSDSGSVTDTTPPAPSTTMGPTAFEGRSQGGGLVLTPSPVSGGFHGTSTGGGLMLRATPPASEQGQAR